jgi:hypothetical protein
MAKLGAPIAYARPVALRGAYTISLHRGVIVASIWPRKHRNRPKKTENERRDWLRNMVLATKWMDSGTSSLIRDQFGGGATLARDIQTMMLAGTAFAFPLDNGKWLLPIRFRNLLWTALDKVIQLPGGPLARHPQRWITAPPGAAGTVLTSNGPAALPSWTAP